MVVSNLETQSHHCLVHHAATGRPRFELDQDRKKHAGRNSVLLLMHGISTTHANVRC